MAVHAVFAEGTKKTYTKSVYQYDKGQRLTFEGIIVPEGCEVHFSTAEGSGVSTVQKYRDGGVHIPDGYLETGQYIYAWLCAWNAEKGSKGSIDYSVQNERFQVTQIEAAKAAYEQQETIYTVVIPVIRRPAPIRVYYDKDPEDATDEDLEMEYNVVNENLNILQTGNDGHGMPDLGKYKVEGERLVFTK